MKKTINITIPVFIALFCMVSCCGCGSGWSKARTEKGQLDELKKQTAAIQRVAIELETLNNLQRQKLDREDRDSQ